MLAVSMRSTTVLHHDMTASSIPAAHLYGSGNLHVVLGQDVGDVLHSGKQGIALRWQSSSSGRQGIAFDGKAAAAGRQGIAFRWQSSSSSSSRQGICFKMAKQQQQASLLGPTPTALKA